MSGTNYIASNWRTPTNQNSSKNDNYGLSFDGTGYIDCGNDPQIQLTGDISISVWFKTTSTDTMVIAAKRYNTLGDAYGWQLYCSGGKIAFLVTRSGPTTTNFVGTTTISDGAWHHVLCTINQDSQIAVILDGSTEGTAPLPAGTFIDSNSDLRIGYNQVGPPYYFNGEISEVALFDYLASGATLYGNATSGSGNPMALKPTPVGYWPLGDNSASDPLAQPNVSVEDASVFNFISSSLNTIQLNSPMSTSGTDWSISCWFKSSQSGGNRVLVGYPGSKYFGINFGKLTFWSSDNSFDMTSSLNVNDGNWHNAIYTYNYTTGAWKSYIDGVPDDNQTATTGINIPPWSFFGARSSVQYFADCELNGIAYFGTELSQPDVTSIYNSGVPSDLSSLNPLGWWKLDESANWDVGGSGNWTIPDASGNGNDGTSSGMTSGNLVLSDLTRNLPYENYSLQFDGSLDKVQFNEISLATDYTVSAWAKRNTTANMFLFGNTAIYGYGCYFVGASGGVYLQGSTGFYAFTNSAVTTAMARTDWVNWVFKRDSTAGTLAIYVDGILAQSVTTTKIMDKINTIGGSGLNTGSQFIWDGNIAEVAIWDTNLSSTEVLKLYANGIPQDLNTFTPQPTNWWTLGKESFWDGADWIIRDMIGTNDAVSANMGGGELKGDAPRSQANGVGTNVAVPTNLKGEAGWSDKNGYSINMSSTARTTDTP